MCGELLQARYLFCSQKRLNQSTLLTQDLLKVLRLGGQTSHQSRKVRFLHLRHDLDEQHLALLHLQGGT